MNTVLEIPTSKCTSCIVASKCLFNPFRKYLTRLTDIDSHRPKVKIQERISAENVFGSSIQIYK